MGGNFFGVEDAILHSGLVLTPRMQAAFARIPWSDQYLRERRDTHWLTVDPLMAMAEMSVRHGEILNTDTPNGTWILNCAFARLRGEAGWWLVRKSPLEGSDGLPFLEQEKLLREFAETEESNDTQTVFAFVVDGVTYKLTLTKATP
jgi:hypothetical protein